MGENLGQQVKQIADSQRTGRLIAIGDIHGYSRALTSLLKRIRPVASDTIVCLGDTINRGPDSRGVLE
jgi:serine/threonine protein phosphatase 1